MSLNQNKTKNQYLNDKKQALGKQHEADARVFLEQQGLEFVEQNFACKVGEIDLIFYQPTEHCVIFVEVRYRQSDRFGGAAASVDYKKQQKLKKSAIFYLQKRKLDANVRFDVVAFENNQLNWIESAFS